MQINSIITLFRNLEDFIFYAILLMHQGISLSIVPMQVYVVHLIIKQGLAIYEVIDKLRKFRRFLRNMDQDYPVVENLQPNEDCPICKEQMT